jgi:YbbR domain-containing protein
MKKKILYILLSVLIAFSLWAYVITTVSPEWEETYESIPVILNNEQALHGRDLMLDDSKIPTVTLKLKGNRSDLIKLNRSNITLKADLSRIYSSGKQYLTYSIAFPGDVPANSVEVLSQSPMEITVEITERKTKEVPVVLDYGGTSVPAGFRTDKDNRILDHETVTITGPAAVIDQISQAKIDVDLTGQKETLIQSYPYTLCDDSGEAVDAERVETDVEAIQLTLKIQRYQDLKLHLSIVYGGGATAENTTVTMDIDTIQVSGTERALKDLGDVLELGELRLSEIPEDGIREYEIKLPENIENLTGKSKVVVTVKFSGLFVKTLRVTTIEPFNIPEGMSAKILTEELEVTIRGTVWQIGQLTEEDLTVRVDLSAAELGTDTYKALVYMDSAKYGNCGALGNYKVDAEITVAESEEGSQENGTE